MKYRNILLVDDDEDDRQVFQSVISSISKAIQCVVLGDTDIALEKLAVREINPDLIFLGLNTPTMDGRDFLITVKESGNLKDIPVIVLSGSPYFHSVNETKKLGALDFIAKPGKRCLPKVISGDRGRVFLQCLKQPKIDSN